MVFHVEELAPFMVTLDVENDGAVLDVVLAVLETVLDLLPRESTAMIEIAILLDAMLAGAVNVTVAELDVAVTLLVIPLYVTMKRLIEPPDNDDADETVNENGVLTAYPVPKI
jgi:hypothetical protein